MATLTQAFKQWSTRADDEKYGSLQAIHEAAVHVDEMAREARGVPVSSLRVEAREGEVALVGKANVPSALTHFAFGQIAQRVGAPAGYLRGLPATLAAQNINHGLSRDEGPSTNLLLQQNGGFLVRGFASDDYKRIPNTDITSRLLRLAEEQPEWQPAPAAFDGSRGLYLSRNGAGDLFCFLVDNGRRIFEHDPNGGLSRGFFVENMELPGKKIKVTKFKYEYVCGNHRVWGAQDVIEFGFRHTGKVDERFMTELEVQLVKYRDASAEQEELEVEKARTYILGAKKEDVLDRVFGLRIPGLTRTLITQGYELAEKREDWYGAPNTVWGLTGGLTEIARDIPFADERTQLDRAAGKLMQVAF